VKTDPRVIAAYLGVDDEEVETVLTEVGDDEVLERLDAGPDVEHGPEASASMLAGPVSETIGHPNGERVTVSKGASKAEQVDAAAARSAEARPVAKATRKPSASKSATKPAAAAGRAPKAAAASSKASAAKTAPEKPASTAKPAPAKTAPKPASVAKPAPAKAAPKPAAAASKGIANRLAAPRGGRPDDLLVIKGIGPVNQRKLNEHGIFHFDQIAAWKKADIEAVEAYLAFDGRIAREDWIGQAKALEKAAAKQASARHKATPATAKRGGRK
jgi:branched-chain amino acid transport system ATP-binding protein